MELAASCRASKMPPVCVFHGGSLEANPDVWAALASPENPGLSRSPQLVSPGCSINGCCPVLRPLAATVPGACDLGGALAYKPRCVTIFSIIGCSRFAAMIFNPPPQFGQCSVSISKMPLSSLAQLRRTGRWYAQFTSHAAGFASCAGASGSCGTTCARSLALGASTPWTRIKCSLGLGTSAASRYMNSSGDITRWLMPSRLAALSLSTTCPAALVCTRSSVLHWAGA